MAEKVPGLTLPLDPLRVALFVLTVLTISRAHSLLGLEALRLPLLLYLFAVGWIFLHPVSMARGGLFQSWPPKVIVALILLACLSMPFGISIGASASFIIDYFSKVVVFALLIVAATRRAADLAFFVWAYVVATALIAYMAVFTFKLESTHGNYAMRLGNMYTFDANDFGLMLVLGIPLTLLAMQTVRFKGKVLCILLLCAIGWGVARTGSRGAFVTLIAVGLTMLLVPQYVPFWKRLLAVTSVAVVLAVAAPTGYWRQMETILRPKGDYNLSAETGRKQVALRGLEYMNERPILGWGIVSFERLEFLRSIRKNRLEGSNTNPRWMVAHNSWIQVGVELGIPGLALWASLVFGGVIALRRLRRRVPHWRESDDPEQRFIYAATHYLVVAFVGFAVGATFLSFAFYDTVYLLAAFVAGVYHSVNDLVRRGAYVITPPPAVRAWRSKRARLAAAMPLQ